LRSPRSEKAEERLRRWYIGSEMRDPLESLSPTALTVIGAARQILLDEGLDSVTIRRVAERAGVRPYTVSYHFGDKTGLILAVLDSLIDHANVLALRLHEIAPIGAERVRLLADDQKSLAKDLQYWPAAFQLVGLGAHDENLRPRLAAMRELYQQLVLDSLAKDAGDETMEKLAPLATLMLAVMQGIAYRYCVDPEGFDPNPAWDLWTEMAIAHMRRILSAAGGPTE
jgi:AcrR family transcriptional regulator